MASLVYHAETLIPTDDPFALEDRLNALVVAGASIVSVVSVSCVRPLTDPVTKIGHYSWYKIIYTTSSLAAAAPASVVVGVTSVQLVPANPNRKGLRFFVTTDKKIVSLGFGAAAQLNKGVTLIGGVTGGAASTFEMNDRSFSTEAINAIADAAGTIVAVQEFT